MFSRLTYMSQWLTNPRIKPVACYCSRGGGILVHRFVRPLVHPSFRSCSLAAAAIFSGWSSVQQIAFSFFILFLHLSLTNALPSLSAYFLSSVFFLFLSIAVFDFFAFTLCLIPTCASLFFSMSYVLSLSLHSLAVQYRDHSMTCFSVVFVHLPRSTFSFPLLLTHAFSNPFRMVRKS